jgi:hypothetical protein
MVVFPDPSAELTISPFNGIVPELSGCGSLGRDFAGKVQ